MSSSNNTFVPSGHFLTSTSPIRPLTIRIPAPHTFNAPAPLSAPNPAVPHPQPSNTAAPSSTPTASPFKIKLKVSPPKKPDAPKKPEWPPRSEVQDRLSKNPQLIFQNAREIVEDILMNGAAATLAQPALPDTASSCLAVANYESASRYLFTKQALFPDTPMLHPKSRKPYQSKKRTSGGNGNDNGHGDDNDNGNGNGHGADVDPDPEVGASSDTSDAPASPFRVRGERERKRARHAYAAPTPVTREEARHWVAVIGRIVKGKARLTLELIGEVNGALDAMEERKNDFTNEILQDNVLEIVRLLSEMQDNVYALDGLRARAKALVTAWSWIMTR